MKNYVGFANDHSGSIAKLSKACASDYNATITAIKDAASREMLDTVVSVVGIGIGEAGYGVKRQVVISNPHVLKPVTSWQADGGTPLYDGIGNLIELFKSLPDYDSPDVSFLVMTTTDGEEQHSKKYTRSSLSSEIAKLQATGRWTFVFRVPKGAKHTVSGLGVPLDNIQEWETTVEGMAKSTVATTQAVDSYYATRSAGAKSSSVFYANAANVSVAAVKANLVDISSELSVWKVLPEEHKSEIATFAQKRLASPLLKGAAFYQLSKTEAKVGETKKIMIRDKLSGRVYVGDAARTMIGLPLNGTIRLKVGDFGNYDIFIQSTSTNRHVMEGTEILYHAKSGVPFTEADQPWLQAKNNVTPVTAKVIAGLCFASREEAREYARKVGKSVQDNGKHTGGKRWYVAN